MQHNELMESVSKLTDKVEVLENDLKQTKKVYGDAVKKLIKKVKSLEKTVKSSKARRNQRAFGPMVWRFYPPRQGKGAIAFWARPNLVVWARYAFWARGHVATNCRSKKSKARRIAHIVVSNDEEKDSFNQGRKIIEIDKDPNISLVQQMISYDAQTQRSQEHDLEPDFKFTAPEEVYTAEPDISTANVPVSIIGAQVSTAIPEVSIAAKNLVYIRRSAAKRKDKGKAIMKEAEPVQKKTKLQLEQERLGYEEALRLQEQLDEEKRQRLLVEMINERNRLFSQQRAEQRRNKPMNQAQQRTYMCTYIKNMGSHTLQQLKKLSFNEIKDLFETTMKRVKDFVPMDSDRSVPKIAAGSSKRDAEEELNEESSKRQKIEEGSEPAEGSKDQESDELS
ncbi:hypothetical protein Tco_0304395 [Tanacetum coccineum]